MMTRVYASHHVDDALEHQRSLAQRAFALGVEALECFMAGAPLHRVHERVFGVLALESEAVDPRPWGLT